ncbi:IS5 family transposase [Pseudochelatococcus sp. G4_1912]
MGGYPFYINDIAWSKLQDLLPKVKRGRRRVNDRRVVSGIVYVLQSGVMWRQAPAIYGPHKTLYTRYQRWNAQGVWTRIFQALSEKDAQDETLMIDSTTIRVQRSALGAQKKDVLPQVDLAAVGRVKSTWPVTGAANPSHG